MNDDAPNWLELAERSGFTALDYAIEEYEHAADAERAAGRKLLRSLDELRAARRKLDQDDDL